MDTSRLTKPEHRYMLEQMFKYLYTIFESKLKATMSTDKEDFKVFFQENTRFCFDQFQDRHLVVRVKVYLLTSRAIKEEMHTAMGKILKTTQAMPIDISGL